MGDSASREGLPWYVRAALALVALVVLFVVAVDLLRVVNLL